LRIFEHKEQVDIQNSVLTIQNFAVRMTNIPSANFFGSLEEMKAYLWFQIERLIEQEEQVIEKIKDIQRNETQIVSIQFAMTDQSQLKYLLQISQANQQIEIFKLKLQRKLKKETLRAKYEK
jgi:hypothetical protein